MSFSRLKQRVERSEALVDGRIRQVGESQSRLRQQWREAWTPLRIVVAGLATGFVSGRVGPEKAIGSIGKVAGPGTVQLLSSAIGLVGSLQAAFAAMTAREATETTDDAAQAAEQTAEQAASAAAAHADPAGPAAAAAEPPRRPDERWDSQPSPAEAATELSER